MPRYLRSLFAALAALLVIGCGPKVSFEADAEVSGFDAKTFTVTAPNENHRVKVEVTSEQPVSSYIFMTNDIKLEDSDTMRDPKKAVGRGEKGTSLSFDATIPRKEDFTVAVFASDGKKTKFKIKINSQ